MTEPIPTPELKRHFPSGGLQGHSINPPVSPYEAYFLGVLASLVRTNPDMTITDHDPEHARIEVQAGEGSMCFLVSVQQVAPLP